MRQHPIPQNILDIEFKLFTKFTVREFVYIATGVGFGGMFLYLFTKGTVPGIVALPMFLFTSGTGLFLGLVPINEQNADIFIRNYFLAITRPTRRVWKSERFDEKVATIARQKGLDLIDIETEGKMERSSNKKDEAGKAKIVGGNVKSLPENQFIESETLAEIEEEESERLQEIDQISQELEKNGVPIPVPSEEESSTATLPSVNEEESPSNEFNYQLPEESQFSENVDQDNDTQFTAAPPPFPIETDAQLTSDTTLDSPATENFAPIFTQTVPDPTGEFTAPAVQLPQQPEPEIPQIDLREVQPIGDKPQTPTLEEERGSTVSNVAEITISKDTYEKYETAVEGYSVEPGKIGLHITDSDGSGVNQAMVIVRDQSHIVKQVFQSDPQGLVLPERKFDNGQYQIEIRHDHFQFPHVTFVHEGVGIPVVNIKALR